MTWQVMEQHVVLLRGRQRFLLGRTFILATSLSHLDKEQARMTGKMLSISFFQEFLTKLALTSRLLVLERDSFPVFPVE